MKWLLLIAIIGCTARLQGSQEASDRQGKHQDGVVDDDSIHMSQHPDMFSPIEDGMKKGHAYDVDTPMTMSHSELEQEAKKVDALGQTARSNEWRKSESQIIQHDLLDYNPKKRAWMKPTPKLAKLCPQQTDFSDYSNAKYVLLKTWCADVDPDNCRACAVRKHLELSSQDDGDNMRLDKCASIKVSYLCDNMGVALNQQVERWKRRTAYVQPLFRPKGGFHTAYGEMAACVLGKAEAVLDTLYSMTHCSEDQWTDEKGSDCYVNTVRDLNKDIGQCCAGYEHIVLFEMEATCDAAVLPLLDPIRQFLKPAWVMAQRHPDVIDPVRKKYDKCMKEAMKFPHMPHKPTGEGGKACDEAYSFGHARKIFKLAVKAAKKIYAKGNNRGDVSPVANKLMSALHRGEPYLSEYIIRFLMKYDEAAGNAHDQRR